MSNKAFITDYIENPNIEQNILGESLSMESSGDIEVLLVWHQVVDAQFIDRFPNLRGIVRYGVGFDQIDLDYAKSKNIFVCNTPDYGTEEVADTAIAMVMNIARGISRYDHQCRNYRHNWQENTISSLQRNRNMTLGVIGAGRIGGGVISRANALRFETIMFDPYVPYGHEKMLGAQRVRSLDELLSKSDIVTIHCPLNQETNAMIDDRFIAQMKPGSSLVNTARGGLIQDLDSFYQPLKSGQLHCVALDVLPNEPPGSGKLIDAWRARDEWLDGRLLINPHTAYYSEQAFVEMREKTALNALAIINNERPINIVNGM